MFILVIIVSVSLRCKQKRFSGYGNIFAKGSVSVLCNQLACIQWTAVFEKDLYIDM